MEPVEQLHAILVAIFKFLRLQAEAQNNIENSCAGYQEQGDEGDNCQHVGGGIQPLAAGRDEDETREQAQKEEKRLLLPGYFFAGFIHVLRFCSER